MSKHSEKYKGQKVDLNKQMKIIIDCIVVVVNIIKEFVSVHNILLTTQVNKARACKVDEHKTMKVIR